MLDLYEQFKDFKSFEIVFTDPKNDLQKLYCDVKRIENNSVILAANNKKNNNIVAPAGTVLKISIYTGHGIYSSTAKVLDVIEGRLFTEYVISYPENSKHHQRREYFRAEMPVDFKLTTPIVQEENANLIIDSKTKNISGKGMCFISDEPFPEHGPIDIELFFNDRSVNTLARLVYFRRILVNNIPKYVHAFNFTSIAPRDTDYIVKQCFLHQLDLKKSKQLNYF